MTKFALVGDVGGTNARLALCDLASGVISRAKTYSGLDYPSLEAVVRVYLEEHQVTVNEGCIAIACPITGDWVAMTNHTWAFSIAEMKRNLGFAHLEIINDFTAVSMAIPMLKAEHLIQFGGSAPVAGKPIAVYGAGTGLGVAHLVHVDKRWVSLPGEGGHVDFAPNSEEEGIILEELRAELGHVSAERVLSGPGLVNLYRAIVKSDGRLPENLQPREVTERALADSCTIAASGIWFISISTALSSPWVQAMKSSPQVTVAPIFSSTSAKRMSPCTLLRPIPVTFTVPPLMAPAARKYEAEEASPSTR